MAAVSKDKFSGSSFHDVDDDIINLDEFEPAQSRIDKYLADFRNESPYIREMILKDISAVDALARLGAGTIPELVLSNTALKEGIILDPNNPPKLACPQCDSLRTAPFPGENNLYRCYSCGKKFASNTNSIISNSHLSLKTWYQIVHSMLSGDSVVAACKKCGLSTAGTFIKARLRVFYALHIFFGRHPIRLYGKVQCDETFPEISYRGYNLKRTNLFPATDAKYPQRFKLRESKKRSGPTDNPNASKLCLFAAATERASFVCYCGIGQPTVEVLRHYVPTGIFLPEVPEQDDFPYSLKKKDIELTDKPGDASLYLCDGSQTMRRFGRDYLPMKVHSRVYRKNGVQLKLPKSELDLHLQRVNNLHSRVKRFLRDSGCSSRFVKGQLLVFNFITNTGGLDNKEAVDELMRILVEPHLGKSQAYLEEMFATLPNQLLEWRTQDKILAKLPEKHVQAAFLIDMIVHPENHPNVDFESSISEKDVVELTGMKMEDIWAIYRDYTEAELIPRILNLYYKGDEAADEKSRQKKQKEIDSITPTDYILFDRFVANRVLPAHERVSLQTLCENINREHPDHQPEYSSKNAPHIFDKIEKLGLRPKRPPLNVCNRTLYSYSIYDFGFVLVREYLDLVREKEEQGETFFSNHHLFSILAANHPEYSRGTILNYFSLARQYLQHENPSWELPPIPTDNQPPLKGNRPRYLAHYKLPTERELLSLTIEFACEDYIKFCASTTFSEEAEDEFLYKLLEMYHFRGFNINTLRARILHQIQHQTVPAVTDEKANGRVYGKSVPESAIKTLRVYEEIVQEYLDKGMRKPSFAAVLDRVQAEVGLAPWTLKKNIAMARAYYRLVCPERLAEEEPDPSDERPKFRFQSGPRVYGKCIPPEAFKTMAVYERVLAELKGKSKDNPPYWAVMEAVQEELHIPLNTIRYYVNEVKQYRIVGADDISNVHLLLSADELELVFDEYAEYRRTHVRNTEEELAFMEKLAETYYLDISPRCLLQFLLAVSRSPAHKTLPSYLTKGGASFKLSKKAYQAWGAYQNLVQLYVKEGKEPPNRAEAAAILENELLLARNSIIAYITRVEKELTLNAEHQEKVEQMSFW